MATTPKVLLRGCLAICTATLAAAMPLTAAKAADPGYRLLKEIAVGGEDAWDYLSMDSAARRLYVTRGSHIVVIDLDKETVVGDIANTPGVHGFALAPELGRGFSSNGGEAKVGIVDLKSLATVSKVDTGAGPDAILYEPSRQEVYAFNGRGNSATVFGAKSGAVIATIALPGKPESGVADSSAGRVYLNIEDKNTVVAIDTKTHTVVNTWPIAPGESASGMAFDAAHHRLFLGCENQLMVMMDSANGKVVATAPIGQRVDANAFDAGSQLAFSSNGEGTVTIAHEDSSDKLTVVQTLKTQPSARTMALDPKTHKIYLSAATMQPQPAAEPGAARQRPVMAPNSFKVLVYGPSQ